MRVQLGEVAAGSCVEEISFTASDEGGRPVAAGITGKVMCGWMRKARTAKFAEEGTLVLLPKLPVTTEVRHPHMIDEVPLSFNMLHSW